MCCKSVVPLKPIIILYLVPIKTCSIPLSLPRSLSLSVRSLCVRLSLSPSWRNHFRTIHITYTRFKYRHRSVIFVSSPSPRPIFNLPESTTFSTICAARGTFPNHLSGLNVKTFVLLVFVSNYCLSLSLSSTLSMFAHF